MQESALFGESALPKLLKLCDDKIVAFTMTEKIDGNFYNCAKIIHNGVVVHTQPKVNLFKFGDEDKYFKEGKVENIKIIEIDGLKYAILICFEIRFIEFWEKIKGADIILVLALWGKLRKEQFEAITKSLAIMNQAFVIASGSSNENMASSSAIITPFGKEFRDEKSEFITKVVDLKEIKKMRRYMDVGIL
jgi:predicted amidohydrolase